MSRSTLKSSLYLQESDPQRRRSTSSSPAMVTQATQRHNQGNTVTYEDVAQLLQTNVGDEEEHVDFAAELEKLLGSYGRMN